MEYVTPVNGDPNDPTRAYVDGDPSLGQAGSIPSARFFNLLLAEARNLVEGAGLALDPNDDAQWLAAIFKILSDGDYLRRPDVEQFGLFGTKITGATDLNEIKDAGFYYVGEALNRPIARNGHLTVNGVGSDDTVCQFFTPYGIPSVYVRTRNSGNAGGEWDPWVQLENSCPGEVKTFATSSPPPGWLKANGAAISRTSYPELYAAIGTTYGTGDGATTFNLPDLRGEFIRGWDDGRGVDAGRGFGIAQGDEFRSHSHRYFDGDTIHVDMGRGGNSPPPTVDGNATGQATYTYVSGGNETVTTIRTVSSGGTETRPRNVALLYCIKY